MKKLLLILATVFSVTAISAQNRNTHYDRRDYPVAQSNDRWDDRNDHGQRDNRGYDNRRNDRYERQRQEEYDRMNRDYDRRIENYRRDRNLSNYERQRQIEQAERERQQKAKSFGKGLVVGGIAAIILGAIMSR